MLSWFLARLKHEMEMMVMMFSPKILQVVYSLAKHQEALKINPSTIRSLTKRSLSNKFQVGQGFGLSFKSNAIASTSSSGPVNRCNSLSAATKKPLNLTPKKAERKKT